MNANLFYGYFEIMGINEVLDTMKAMQGTMAIEITSSMSGGLYTVSAYGTFDGDAEDWGLEDADCDMFQGEARFESTKKLYETMKANGEF